MTDRNGPAGKIFRDAHPAGKDFTDTKKVFRKCMTCSRTLFFILDREYGYPKDREERASDLLAGGLKNTGHQCGMLWGATLAAGAESFRRYPDDRGRAMAGALAASEDILASFVETAGTADCREITGCNLASPLGMASFTARFILTGMEKSVCFNLAERWAPGAVRAAEEGLSRTPAYSLTPACCASEVARKMGATDEQMVTVAGLSGGIGLSGNACGALGAAIWMKTLAWCQEHPGKNPPYFFNREANRTMKAFSAATGGEILCHRICGRRFETIDDHTQFVKDGGCAALIDALAGS
jgi:hypothetical protein